MTRIIRITECAKCRWCMGELGCLAANNREPCPPTGIPDWCPLEMLEAKHEPTT